MNYTLKFKRATDEVEHEVHCNDFMEILVELARVFGHDAADVFVAKFLLKYNDMLDFIKVTHIRHVDTIDGTTITLTTPDPQNSNGSLRIG